MAYWGDCIVFQRQKCSDYCPWIPKQREREREREREEGREGEGERERERESMFTD